jgi:hypothetical protein
LITFYLEYNSSSTLLCSQIGSKTQVTWTSVRPVLLAENVGDEAFRLQTFVLLARPVSPLFNLNLVDLAMFKSYIVSGTIRWWTKRIGTVLILMFLVLQSKIILIPIQFIPGFTLCMGFETKFLTFFPAFSIAFVHGFFSN